MANVLQTLSVYYDDNFVNYQEAGTIQKKTNNKKYIQLKSTKKTYLVRYDKQNNKCILSKGKELQLSSLKGQFIYIK